MTENPKKYVFVGTSGQRGELGFTAIGQSCSLLDADYADAVKGGLALIPKHVYDSFGFTQEEISKWGPTGSHTRGNERFLTKLRRAREEYRKIRENLSAGKSVKLVVKAPMLDVAEPAATSDSEIREPSALSSRTSKRSLSNA